MARYGTSGDYFYHENDEGKLSQISALDYYQGRTAQDTGPIESGLVSAGERMTNLFNKVPGIDMDRAPEGSMEALEREHPVSTTVGTMAPYLATAPLAASVGIPGAIGMGAAEGYGFSKPGAETMDTVLGGLGGGLGNMAGRVIQKIAPHFPGQHVYDKPALTTTQIQRSRPGSISNMTGRSKQGWWDRNLANTLGGKGPAQLFGRQNQERINQLVADALGLPGKQTTKIDGASLPAAYARTMKEAHELTRKIAIGTKEYPGIINPVLQEQATDAVGKAKIIELAMKSVDDTGNINPGKWMRANELYEKGVSKGESAAYIGSRGNKVMERAEELTDPKLGVFTHGTGRSEEVLADLGRTAFMPHTGIPSLLNFAPSWTPVGKGGAAGTVGGIGASTGLLDRR